MSTDLASVVSLERRFLTATDSAGITVTRSETDTGPIGFKGRAIVYGSRTAIGNPLRWGFYEEVQAGAATESIGQDDIRFLQDHDSSLLLARNTSGTLRLTDSLAGVDCDADMAPTSYARDLALLLERKDLTGMSFAFRVLEDIWSTFTVDVNTPAGPATVEVDLRTLIKIQLVDVSAVTYPAYVDTTAGLRSAGTLAAFSKRRELVDAEARCLAEGRFEDLDELIAARRAARGADTPKVSPATSRRQLHHRGLAAFHGLDKSA